MAAVRPKAAVPQKAWERAARRLQRADARARRVQAEGEEDDRDAFALDARLRELVAAEQRVEAELAEVLLAVAEGRRYRGCSFPTLDAWVREELGMSPRKARMLLRLARTARRVPALSAAWRSGELSFLRAYTIVPVLLDAPEHASAWIARARAVTCRRLEEDADAALLAADLDPAAFAATGGSPAQALGMRSPPTGKQVRRPRLRMGARIPPRRPVGS